MSAPDPHGGTRASWNSADTRPCRLRVVNRSEAAADALWVSVEGNEASYAVIQPNTAHIQGLSAPVSPALSLAISVWAHMEVISSRVAARGPSASL